MAGGIGGFIGSIAGGILTGGAGPAIGEGIGKAIPQVGEVAKVIVDRLVPDPTKQAAAQAEIEAALTARESNLLNALAAQNAQQNAINLAEAQGNDRFSSRWRPALGWVGVISVGWQFVVAPTLTWLVSIVGALMDVAIPVPPTVDTSQLWVLLTGLLGLSASRTYERTTGVPGALPGPQVGRR